MAMGGGNFTVMNKTLPGTYINIVSKDIRSNDGFERGAVAMGLSLDWGEEGKLVEVGVDDLTMNAAKLFGHELTDDSMVFIREIFQHATTLYAYRLNSGGTKATNKIATAKYAGTAGNNITVTISADPDDSTNFIVKTIMEGTVRNRQTVKTAAELVDNDFVTFAKDATLSVSTNALSGGTNGTVAAKNHSDFLTALEQSGDTVNVIGVDSTDSAVKKVYEAYAQRHRDDEGDKVQIVVYDDAAADYEGVISVKNKTTNADEAALVYWVAGAEAGCELGESVTNMTYDGELTIEAPYTQAELEDLLNTGNLVFHKVGDEFRVLIDVNTLTTYTAEKNKLFAKNDIIRTVDALANNLSYLFNNTYCGKYPNNDANRNGLWADIVDIFKELQNRGVITNFSSSDVVIGQGKEKGDVVVQSEMTVTTTMERLYVTSRVA